MRVVLLLLVVSSLTVGCAHTAMVQTWEPATIDVAGMNRVAVVTFQGDSGPAVAASLNSQLWENGFYEVVDASGIQSHIVRAGYETMDPIDPNEILGPARQAGLDGILMGEVVEYRCDDERFDSSHIHIGSDAVEDDHGKYSSTGFGIETNSTLVRDGSVAIAFKLVDVRTGEIRAAKTVSHHFHGEVVNGNGRIPSQGEVLEALTTQCLDEIVCMVAPHQEMARMKLAKCDLWVRGRSQVASGIKLARDGDWNAADELWKAAIKNHPGNHAALYNRALAAMARQDYETAENFAMEALKVQHKSDYAKGLASIRKYRATYETSQRQKVQSQLVSTDEADWR
ncbi:MAG: hypothetical protein KDA80_24290 [Planctomycetaceae bacterium]|nr:hypothetical protein [Planctomycetaceae bacterium]